MSMKKYLIAVLAALAALGAMSETVRTSFNDDWEYKWEDEADWTRMTAPYDAARLRGFHKETASPGQAYIPCGFLSCRKTFDRPKGDGEFFIKFDGVYQDSTIKLNGTKIGSRHNGYVGFEVPLKDLKNFNLLEIEMDCRVPNARWYAGGGLLRNVWLLEKRGFAVDPEAVFVKTDLDLTNDCAVVEVTVEGDGLTVVEPKDGKLVLEHPRLWSPDEPNLYTQKVTVCNAEGKTDTVTKRYGVRKIEFTKDYGMFLNGVQTRIRGVCQHENFGCLGNAVNIPALRRMLTSMKSIGANAIRTTHHPFAPEFYDLCDEMGFMVYNEVFDEWTQAKGNKPYSYARYFEEDGLMDLAAFVRRDRNHPSVILWSIGNEIPEMTDTNDVSKTALKWTERLVAEVKKYDTTRPVTASCRSAIRVLATGCFAPLDVVGLNYGAVWYKAFRDDSRYNDNDYKLFGSETAATCSSRDTYLFTPVGDRMEIVEYTETQEHSYAVRTPFAGSETLENTFKVQIDSPWSAGEFSWCFADYLGEPSHSSGGAWPARSSYWGIVDIAGFPKDRYYLHQAMWTDKPVVYLSPDWNFKGYKVKGKKVPVRVLTNAESVELFLNGESQGVRTWKDTSDLHFSWDVPYVPGVLEARATMADGTVVTNRRETVGKVTHFKVTTDFEYDDTVFLRIDAVDANDRRVIAYEKEVDIGLPEGVEILGIDNGDATNTESFTDPHHQFFRGSLLVIAKRTGSVEDLSKEIKITQCVPDPPDMTFGDSDRWAAALFPWFAGVHFQCAINGFEEDLTDGFKVRVRAYESADDCAADQNGLDVLTDMPLAGAERMAYELDGVGPGCSLSLDVDLLGQLDALKVPEDATTAMRSFNVYLEKDGQVFSSAAYSNVTFSTRVFDSTNATPMQEDEMLPFYVCGVNGIFTNEMGTGTDVAFKRNFTGSWTLKPVVANERSRTISFRELVDDNIDVKVWDFRLVTHADGADNKKTMEIPVRFKFEGPFIFGMTFGDWRWSAALYPWVRGVHLETDLLNYKPSVLQDYTLTALYYDTKEAFDADESGTAGYPVVSELSLAAQDQQLIVERDGAHFLSLDIDLNGKIDFPADVATMTGFFRVVLKKSGEPCSYAAYENVTFSTRPVDPKTETVIRSKDEKMLPVYVSGVNGIFADEVGARGSEISFKQNQTSKWLPNPKRVSGIMTNTTKDFWELVDTNLISQGVWNLRISTVKDDKDWTKSMERSVKFKFEGSDFPTPPPEPPAKWVDDYETLGPEQKTNVVEAVKAIEKAVDDYLSLDAAGWVAAVYGTDKIRASELINAKNIALSVKYYLPIMTGEPSVTLTMGQSSNIPPDGVDTNTLPGIFAILDGEKELPLWQVPSEVRVNMVKYGTNLISMALQENEDNVKTTAKTNETKATIWFRRDRGEESGFIRISLSTDKNASSPEKK